MNEYASMWDGHLGKIIAKKHRIQLKPPDTSPVHVTPSHAGPQKWKLKKEQIEWMLKADAAEPASTE